MSLRVEEDEIARLMEYEALLYSRQSSDEYRVMERVREAFLAGVKWEKDKADRRADEIARLQADNERLRAALQEITDTAGTVWWPYPFLADDMDRIARKALEDKPSQDAAEQR